MSKTWQNSTQACLSNLTTRSVTAQDGVSSGSQAAGLACYTELVTSPETKTFVLQSCLKLLRSCEPDAEQHAVVIGNALHRRCFCLLLVAACCLQPAECTFTACPQGPGRLFDPGDWLLRKGSDSICSLYAQCASCLDKLLCFTHAHCQCVCMHAGTAGDTANRAIAKQLLAPPDWPQLAAPLITLVQSIVQDSAGSKSITAGLHCNCKLSAGNNRMCGVRVCPGEDLHMSCMSDAPAEESKKSLLREASGRPMVSHSPVDLRNIVQAYYHAERQQSQTSSVRLWECQVVVAVSLKKSREYSSC